MPNDTEEAIEIDLDSWDYVWPFNWETMREDDEPIRVHPDYDSREYVGPKVSLGYQQCASLFSGNKERA
jgi:hypothetical protein